MGPRTPTIVLIDDSAEVRELIRTQFQLSGDLDVVADGENGVEAISLAHEHKPDLLLLDMSMPQMDGLDALTGISAVSPSTRVVVFTGFDANGLADKAQLLGAAALIEKTTPIERLASKLLAVLDDSGEPLPGRAQLQVVPTTPEESAGPAGQEVLDEHVERFREVFERAAIGMATMTLTGGIVRANQALGDLLLWPSDDLVGIDYATLTAGQGDQLDAALAEVGTGKVSAVHMEHDVSGSIEPRRVRATMSPIRDSEGRALYVLLQVQDITAQRAAEGELRSSEDRFRLLVDAVEEYAIFMLSPDGIIASWNAGAQRVKGYHADEIIGRHFRTFYRPEQQAARHPEYELERALQDGHYSEEGWRVRKDGSEFWAHVLITAVFDDAGEHVGFTKVTRDQTADREAHEILRRSEERFRLLVEAVGDYAIFMLDPSGRVVSWNSGAQRNKGYTSREIIGQHFRIFYPPESQAEHHPEHELEVALREGRYEEEGWRVRKDGTRFWANVVITAVFNDVGEHVGFAKVTRDQTERRVAEQERDRSTTELAEANATLEKLNARLKRAADDQSQFLAMTTHELRTPTAVLGGSATTLARHWDELDNEQREKLLAGMKTSADRLDRLLTDLLTATRIEANVLGVTPVPSSVAVLVTNAVDAARTRYGIEVEVEDFDDLTVMVDPERVAQAIDNLIGNALIHGAPPIQIAVRAVESMAQIRVSDAGPGVDPTVLPRLFERFVTGDSFGGTGLGLFIVRELARANGGDATYEPDQGDFVLSLPLA